jgi:dipeptidyl aminopeptidase/acylaminoacyl peptidase
LNPAYHTSQPIYLVSLYPRNASERAPRALTSGTHGATSSPVFSPDAKHVAWLEMSQDGYEADRRRVVVVSLDDLRQVSTDLGGKDRDRSPDRIKWRGDGKAIYAVAEEEGHKKVRGVSDSFSSRC